MFASALFHVFVFLFAGGFIAVAVLGHVLLTAAIWPGLFRRKREPHGDAVPLSRQIRQH